MGESGPRFTARLGPANGVGIGVILLTVVQSTVSLHLYTTGREALSRTFDRVSFAVILPAYALLNIALPLSAAPR